MPSRTGNARAELREFESEGPRARHSLVIGLSDVASWKAGGVKLDAVFVDAGFGSAFPVRLHEAIKTLKDLETGGRLVGLSSHHPELQVGIPAKLEIRGGKRGSSAAFSVP